MALGAITRDEDVGQRGGPVIAELISFAGDSSYTTGGTVGFTALVRTALARGDVTILGVVAQNLSDHVVRFDEPNDTLLVSLMSTGAEVGNGVNLSGITFKLLVICK